MTETSIKASKCVAVVYSQRKQLCVSLIIGKLAF